MNLWLLFQIRHPEITAQFAHREYQLVPDRTDTNVPSVRYVQQRVLRIVEMQYGVDWPGRLFRCRVQVPRPDAAKPVAVGKEIDLIAV